MKRRTYNAPYRAKGWLGRAVLVVALSCALHGRARAQEEEDVDYVEDDTKLTVGQWFDQAVSGALRVGVDYANADGESDLDSYQSLRLRLDPPKHENIHVRAMAYFHEDLDSGESRYSVLRDINDTYSSDVRARVHSLYVEFEDLWGDSSLRLGRQRITEGIAFNRIDGAYFRKNYGRWNWYLFGGLRASVYEHRFDDTTAGGGFAVQIVPTTRVAVDAYYGEESRRRGEQVRRGGLARWLGLNFPRRVKADVDDRQIGFSLWHDFTPNHRAFARYTLNDGRGDELLLNATGYIAPWKVTYDIAYRQLVNRREDRVNDLTSFYRILGIQEEYKHAYFALHRPFRERYVVSLEADVRDTENDSRFTGNRDFQRYAVALDVLDLPWNLETSTALERWEVDGGEGSWAVTGEIRKAWEKVNARLGVDYERLEDRIVEYDPRPFIFYQLYVYLTPGVFPGFTPWVHIFDTQNVRIREDIYSAYTRVQWNVRENQDLTFRVRYEEDDGPQSPYWRFRIEYDIRF